MTYIIYMNICEVNPNSPFCYQKVQTNKKENIDNILGAKTFNKKLIDEFEPITFPTSRNIIDINHKQFPTSTRPIKNEPIMMHSKKDKNGKIIYAPRFRSANEIAENLFPEFSEFYGDDFSQTAQDNNSVQLFQKAFISMIEESKLGKQLSLKNEILSDNPTADKFAKLVDATYAHSYRRQENNPFDESGLVGEELYQKTLKDALEKLGKASK